MTDTATITLNSPASEPGAQVEPATNEHDVAVAEAEATAEIAVAEIHAEAQVAAAETIADALESEAVETLEQRNQWLEDRVRSLEDRLAQQPTPMELETTEALLILPNSEEATEPTTETDPAELEPTPTPLSDASLTDAPESVEAAPPVQEPAPARRKRRLLI